MDVMGRDVTRQALMLRRVVGSNGLFLNEMTGMRTGVRPDNDM
jgi:hypothetical protein